MGAALQLPKSEISQAANDVVWQCTDRQAEFLACDDFEVLYGGAAGGGKTDALLIDALCLQFDAHKNPRHRAILFRKTFTELRDMIDRSQELYPSIIHGAHYNKQEKIWTFPSGARVEFGYLHHENDRFKYRGRAWNYIGFDELTLWGTPTCYLYLFSRCRSTDKNLPRYIRATTNPDGIGQQWVMKRFGIQPQGHATNMPVDIEDEETGIITTIRRRFIPARLIDNPHLSGTGYREALLQLPPEERDALLKGLWVGNKILGAYYATELNKMRATGRIRRVAYTPGIPVNTFWDLGRNDTTAIWFHQKIAGEDRFIHCYENSGEALDHYATYLQGRGYVYGRHYLPHDASHERLTEQTEQASSWQSMLENLLPGQRFEVIPRIHDVTVGINETRMKMIGSAFFDEEGCSQGLVALENYRKRYDAKQQVFMTTPLHDRHSNLADAFRQWGQLDREPANSGQYKRKSGSNWRTR